MRKRMIKKGLSLLLLLAMILTTTACSSNNNPNNDSEQKNQTSNEDTNEGDGANTDEAEVTPEPKGLPPMTTEEIELTYANWGDDPNVAQAMADAFMEKYPNITVYIVNMNAFTYQDDFYVMAQSGMLPDCFMVMDEVGWSINGWLMDITELYDNDPDTEYVFDYIKDLGVYDGVRTMFATNSLPNIAILNKDYFDMYNEPLPSYEEWNFDKAIEIATRLTHPEDMRYGIGKATMFNVDVLPDFANIILNGERGQWGYKEGEGYSFTQDWINMVELRNNLHVQSVFDVATADDKAAVLGDGGAWMAQAGYTAINMDYFWSYDELMSSNSTMVPYPFPTSSGKVPVSSDVVGISAQTQYPREAYELAKWLTFSQEGWDVKIQAYIDNDTIPDKLPNVELPQATKEKFYTAYKNKEGIDAIMNSIKNGYDVSDSYPGWKTFDNWLKEQGYMGQILNWSAPELSAADIADELTAKANEFYQSELQALKDSVHTLPKYEIEDYQ